MKGEKHKQKTPADPAASKRDFDVCINQWSDGGTITKKDIKGKRQHALDTTMLS